jgi:tol-pal system protein YbgF
MEMTESIISSKTRVKYSKPAARVFTAIALAGVLAGCGPGFPIVTEEQQTQTKNVDYLMDETSRLTRKLTELEALINKSMADRSTRNELKKLKRDAGNIRKDVDGIIKSRADTNADLDVIHADISTLRGRLEEKEFEADRMEERLASLAENVSSLQAGFAAVEEKQRGAAEESLETINDNIETLTDSLETVDREVAELKETLTRVDERLSSVEGMPPGLEIEEPQTDPADIYMEAYQDTMDKNYTAAMEKFKKFLDRFPDHKLSDNAQYWVGEIYYARGDWERAILEFDKVVKNFPAGDKAADSLLKQGYSFEKLGDLKTARILLKRVSEEFPQSESAVKARERLEEMK